MHACMRRPPELDLAMRIPGTTRHDEHPDPTRVRAVHLTQKHRYLVPVWIREQDIRRGPEHRWAHQLGLPVRVLLAALDHVCRVATLLRVYSFL